MGMDVSLLPATPAYCGLALCCIVAELVPPTWNAIHHASRPPRPGKTTAVENNFRHVNIMDIIIRHCCRQSQSALSSLTTHLRTVITHNNKSLRRPVAQTLVLVWLKRIPSLSCYEYCGTDLHSVGARPLEEKTRMIFALSATPISLCSRHGFEFSMNNLELDGYARYREPRHEPIGSPCLHRPFLFRRWKRCPISD